MLLHPTTEPIGGARSVATARADARRSWRSWYGLYLVVTLLFAAYAFSSSGQPVSLATLVLVVTLVLAIVRPTLGLYVAMFFAILGDSSTMPWYPAVKNFSSKESILFYGDSFIISPLELVAAALLVGWLLQMMSRHEFRLRPNSLLTATLVFAAFVVFGLVYGLARGGDSNSALWEARSLLYIPLFYILFTNLLTRRRQYGYLFALIIAAVFINSLWDLWYNAITPVKDRLDDQSLVAHGSTLAMNAVFVYVMALWLLKRRTRSFRFAMTLLLVPTVIVYLISERRAAFVALVAGVIILFFVLLWTRRKTFWKVAPVVLLLGSAYTMAFWNSQGSLGFPAQAIKSVIAPSSLDARDQSSDLYREIEKIDILVTINSSKFLGIGFGHEFLRPVALPAITSFNLATFKPHNTILWMWMKTGAGGFVAMLFLFGTSLRLGARWLRTAATDRQLPVLTALVSFIAMYAVYSYVDISWDAQNVVLLSLAIALIGTWPRLTSDPLEVHEEEEAPAFPELTRV